MLPDLTARPRWWVLDGHRPVVADSVVAWAQWFSAHPGAIIVASTTVGASLITTKFTGMDRGVMPCDLPTLFETTVADGLSIQTAGWAVTWDAAEQCHARVVAERQPRPQAPPAPVRRVRLMRKAWAALRRVATRCTVPFFSFESPAQKPPRRNPPCPRD